MNAERFKSLDAFSIETICTMKKIIRWQALAKHIHAR